MAKRRPGKYDHLLHKFKKLPPADLKQQEKINHRKVTLRDCPRCDGGRQSPIGVTCGTCEGTGQWQLTASRLSDLYVIARADLETILLAASAANIELEALTQLLIESQENKAPEWGAFGASDRSLKMTNGDTIRVQSELYGTIKSKAAFRAWCYNNELTVHMELPEKKTQDLVKARAINAQLEPDGIEIFTRAKIVYTPLKTEDAEQPSTLDDDNAF